MLVKTQPKIKTKINLQDSIQYPPSSHNAIVDTGATKHFSMPNIPLIKIIKILPLYVQLTNGTVLKSTHAGNIRLTALPKESTKSHILLHTKSGALISVA